MTQRAVSAAALDAALAATGALAQPSEDAAPSVAPQAADGARALPSIVVRAGPGPRSDASVQVLEGDELVRKRQGGLGETLAGLPGIHLDNFGGGASRPVIRGQTLPRLEVLSDGAPVFDAAAVSADHAIATDPLLLDGIEILRGPAAVVYGGNAVNGAIDLIDGKIPKRLPPSGLTGAAEMRYGSGDREKTAVAKLTTSLGPVAFHVEGSERNADDYAVPKEFGARRLKDSFASSSSWAAGASLITDKGYIGAAFTRLAAEYGLPGHSHANGACHNHGASLHCQAHDSYGDPFAGYDDSHTARIRLRSDRIDVRADHDDVAPGISHLRLRFNDTSYRHDEQDGDIVPARYAHNAWDARVEVTHVPVVGFTGTVGLQHAEGEFSGLNHITAHVASNPLPAVRHRTTALFATESRRFGPFELAVGARAERRQARMAGWEHAFPAYDEQPRSGSLAGTWDLDGTHELRASYTHSQRAPGVRELYASGNNLATNSFEVGLANQSDLPGIAPRSAVLETARSLSLTLARHRGKTTYDLTVFHQAVNDYVYAELLDIDEARRHRFLRYTTADVTFIGLEGEVNRQVTSSWRLGLFGDCVRGTLEDRPGYLPRMPPGRLGSRVRWTGGAWSADVDFTRTFAQKTLGERESPTAGYNRLDATVAFEQAALSGGASTQFYLRGTNLTDALAHSHASFVKEQSPLRGRSIAIGVRHPF